MKTLEAPTTLDSLTGEIDLNGLGGDSTAASTKLQCTDPRAIELAGRIRERSNQMDALKSVVETDKADLRQLVSPLYFSTYHGRTTVESTIEIPIPAGAGTVPGAPVQVQFQNRYSVGGSGSKLNFASQKALLAKLLPAPVLARYFAGSFTIKIKSESLPKAQLQLFVNELKALGVKFNCASAFEIKQVFAPLEDFHTARHTVLTVAENLALNEEGACPIVASVKVNGTRK